MGKAKGSGELECKIFFTVHEYSIKMIILQKTALTLDENEQISNFKIL
jgi:hypothetical protein